MLDLFLCLGYANGRDPLASSPFKASVVPVEFGKMTPREKPEAGRGWVRDNLRGMI